MPNKIQDLLLLLSKSVLFMLLKNLYENTLVNVKVSFSVASEPMMYKMIFFFHEWEHRTGTMCPFSSLYPLRKGKGLNDRNKSEIDVQEPIRNTKIIYIPWPFPSVWGVADNTKETTKTMGISLRSSSNDKGPSRVQMALLEQHSPFSPLYHNLRRFIDAISPTAPTTGLPL